jgi:hypothetical protein
VTEIFNQLQMSRNLLRRGSKVADDQGVIRRELDDARSEGVLGEIVVRGRRVAIVTDIPEDAAPRQHSLQPSKTLIRSLRNVVGPEIVWMGRRSDQTKA